MSLVNVLLTDRPLIVRETKNRCKRTVPGITIEAIPGSSQWD